MKSLNLFLAIFFAICSLKVFAGDGDVKRGDQAQDPKSAKASTTTSPATSSVDGEGDDSLFREALKRAIQGFDAIPKPMTDPELAALKHNYPALEPVVVRMRNEISAAWDNRSDALENFSYFGGPLDETREKALDTFSLLLFHVARDITKERVLTGNPEKVSRLLRQSLQEALQSLRDAYESAMKVISDTSRNTYLEHIRADRKELVELMRRDISKKMRRLSRTVWKFYLFSQLFASVQEKRPQRASFLKPALVGAGLVAVVAATAEIFLRAGVDMSMATTWIEGHWASLTAWSAQQFSVSPPLVDLTVPTDRLAVGLGSVTAGALTAGMLWKFVHAAGVENAASRGERAAIHTGEQAVRDLVVFDNYISGLASRTLGTTIAPVGAEVTVGQAPIPTYYYAPAGEVRARTLAEILEDIYKLLGSISQTISSPTDPIRRMVLNCQDAVAGRTPWVRLPP